MIPTNENRNLSHSHYINRKLPRIESGPALVRSNPILLGERLATNCLIHYTAYRD
jgi:hypothetical protein